MLSISEKSKTNNLKMLYIIVAIMIAFSDECYWFSTADIPFLKTLKNIFLLGLPILLLVKNKFSTKEFNLLSFVIIIVSFSGIINGFALGGPMLFSIMFMGSLLFINKTPFSIFGNVFSNIILALSIFSFVIWIWASFSIESLNTIENIVGTSIHTSCCFLYFDGHSGEIRNACIFREPGVFMIFICLALLFDIYNSTIIPIYRLIIYTLTIFSTYSTAGYIILALCFIIYFLKKGLSSKIILPLLLLLLGLVFLMSSDSIMTSVFGKIEKGQDSASFLGRISSIIIPLNILIENPIFGVGTENFRTEYIIMSKQLFGFEINPDGMSTNTFFNAGAIYGFIFFCFILFGLYRLSRHITKSKQVGLLVLVLFVLMFSNETMIYSYIFITLIAYGYMFNQNKIELQK